MKRTGMFLILIVVMALSFTSCKKDRNEAPNKYVNEWIYENMATYYYWNDELPKKPNYLVSPDQFFKSILYSYDANSRPDGDRFSWIQDNYEELLKSLSGVVSYEIGFEYVRVRVSDTSPQKYYLLVLYPKKGSDAFDKGIKKGDFIVGINNSEITENNYNTLISGVDKKKLSIAKWIYNTEEGEYDLKLTDEIEINMHSNFAENPIYLDSIYTTPSNGKKVGYLVYNFFARDKGDGSNDYDRELMQRLEQMKSTGNVKDFILDLRYNGGGAVSSSTALASTFAPNRSTENIFSVAQYNDLLHAAYKKRYGDDYNKNFFIDEIESGRGDIPVPEMAVENLYILVSNWSASASELVINSLKPYYKNNLYLIGLTTVGKNVGSISLYEEDDEKNTWGMQPIVVKYFNSEGKSDYTAGFEPDYEVDELGKDLYLVDFGDTEDVMLNKALSLINGAPISAAPTRAPRFSRSVPLSVVKGSESMLQKPERNIIIEDMRQEEILNLFK